MAFLMFAAGIALQGLAFFLVLGLAGMPECVRAGTLARDEARIQGRFIIGMVLTVWTISVGLLVATGRVV